MGQLGFPELVIIGIIALLVFGPKKLPDLGAGLGKAIRDFKGALNSKEDAQEDAHAIAEKADKSKELQEPVKK